MGSNIDVKPIIIITGLTVLHEQIPFLFIMTANQLDTEEKAKEFVQKCQSYYDREGLSGLKSMVGDLADHAVNDYFEQINKVPGLTNQKKKQLLECLADSVRNHIHSLELKKSWTQILTVASAHRIDICEAVKRRVKKKIKSLGE